MSERTCSTPDCMRPPKARELCIPCYGKARRAGTLPPKRLAQADAPRHRLTSVDKQAAVGDCEICGPRVPVRVRQGRGAECRAKHAEGLRHLRDSGATRTLASKRKGQRKSQLRRYGLTPERYAAMVEDQEGRCLVCRETPEKLVVDHDHSCCPGRYTCGRCVRGLLCSLCNKALGSLRDNPEYARAAARYLSQP
ncbi:endonuclease VII domain-containing protein [Streptomyces sp. AMCC400023]|uniref:endonuclease VII domain-containing protein n=1 Tax=Streptomyces sp. AMCC400023 TaxID=2056258 RepID=UPI001F2945BA|nr:endonuclease VII domain-containing protein [Streptomyces sp. AMCC400023]UJV41637.1 hypothetical protein CVT30_18830 [Streptomyces sp. AMCC400023]